MNEYVSSPTFSVPHFYSAKIGSIFEGLGKKINSDERMIKISALIFTISVSTAVMSLTLTGIVPLILTGASLMVAVAIAIQLIACRKSLLSSKQWNETLASIVYNNPEQGAANLRLTVKKNWQEIKRHSIFTREARDGFATIDNAKDPLPYVFANMLLIADLKVIQMGHKNGEYEATFKEDLKIIKQCLEYKPSKEQKQIFDLVKRNWEEFTLGVQEIRLPTEISVGHELLAHLIHHLKNREEVEEPDALNDWKMMAKNARLWMKKEGKYDHAAAALIDNILNSSNERECCMIAQNLSFREIELLENQAEK